MSRHVNGCRRRHTPRFPPRSDVSGARRVSQYGGHRDGTLNLTEFFRFGPLPPAPRLDRLSRSIRQSYTDRHNFGDRTDPRAAGGCGPRASTAATRRADGSSTTSGSRRSWATWSSVQDAPVRARGFGRRRICPSAHDVILRHRQPTASAAVPLPPLSRRQVVTAPPPCPTSRRPLPHRRGCGRSQSYDNAGPARGKVRRLCGMKARGAWSGLDDREIRPNH